MSPTLRRVAAVLVGLLVGFAIIFGVEWIGAKLFPLPPGTDPSNDESMRAAMAVLPVEALLLVLVGWILSSLVGGWVAARIAGRTLQPAMIVGTILLAAAVASMLTISHPLWFWVAGVLVFLPSAYAGARLAGASGA